MQVSYLRTSRLETAWSEDMLVEFAGLRVRKRGEKALNSTTAKCLKKLVSRPQGIWGQGSRTGLTDAKNPHSIDHNPRSKKSGKQGQRPAWTSILAAQTEGHKANADVKAGTGFQGRT